PSTATASTPSWPRSSACAGAHRRAPGPRAPCVAFPRALLASSAMIREDEGCTILHRVFEGRGYRIDRDVRLALGPVSFTADGWDPRARVGFEYMTREAGDHDDLDAAEIAALG